MSMRGYTRRPRGSAEPLLPLVVLPPEALRHLLQHLPFVARDSAIP